jgi:xylulokinase
LKKNFLIGVDLGTSTVKATLLNLDGEAIAEASRSMNIYHPKPGYAEQNAYDYVVATVKTVREIMEKSTVNHFSIAALSFDGQMAGAMGIDRHWKPVTPWYPSALDTRYQPYVEKMNEVAGGRLIELNGAMPFAAPRMLWWKELYPDIFKKIFKVIVLPSFVAGALADLKGEDAFMDPSYLTWFGLGNTAERCWSNKLIDLFSFEEKQLPRIVPATTVIGHLSPDSAVLCGLASGTPIVAGTGDQVAGALGAGLVEEGELLDVTGTFTGLITCINNYLPDTSYNMLQPLAGPLSENHWYAMMYIGGGGLTHKWFCDEFGFDRTTPYEGSRALFDNLNKLAAEVSAGSEGLLFVPHLAGRSCPSDPSVRGAWIGFTWTHKIQHFYRALLESIGYDFAQALKVIKHYRSDQSFKDVRVIGGGANNHLWNRIKSDILDLPYMRLPRSDTAVLGCAIIAGHAIGAFPDMVKTARMFIETIDEIKPDHSQHRIYEKYITVYEKIFNQLHDTFEMISALDHS